MVRACVIYAPTGICDNVIEVDDPASYDPGDGYFVASSDVGDVGWTWTGAGWRTPGDIFIDAALSGEPTAPTPSPTADQQIATALFVNQAIADAIAAYILDGSYDAGNFSGAGANFAMDLDAGDLTGAGATFTMDIDAGGFA